MTESFRISVRAGQKIHLYISEPQSVCTISVGAGFACAFFDSFRTRPHL